MKLLSTIFLLFAASVTTTFAQSNQVVFSFEHKAGADPLELNQTVFPIWNAKNVKITRAEFYISEVEIHNADASKTPLTDQYLLVNANAPTAEYDLGTWNLSEAQGATLHLGVPQSVNHNDPAAWPPSHPLAPQNPSMHWGWSAGYRFMAIEGKVDNNGDGIPETNFEFHNLTDQLYKTLELTGVQVAENGVLHLTFGLNYAKLFENIPMTGNLIQHGSAFMNSTMMTNAATKDFVTMAGVSASHEVAVNSLQVSASPNPFSAETLIRYDFPVSESLSMIVFNTLGQAVRTLNGLPSNGSLRFEKGELTKGVYYYAFYENGQLKARKQFIISE